MSENTVVFNGWNDYLEALRSGQIDHTNGIYRRVVYDSVYSDEPQVLEGEIEHSGDSFGRPFRLEDKWVIGWHVESKGRKIGHVKKIEVKQ